MTSGGRPARFTPNEDLLMRYGITRYELDKGREELDTRQAECGVVPTESDAGE